MTSQRFWNKNQATEIRAPTALKFRDGWNGRANACRGMIDSGQAVPVLVSLGEPSDGTSPPVRL